MDNESFTKLLQFSISPIALISGAALFLLSITNRLGRSIDRARSLAPQMGKTCEGGYGHAKEQLRVLLRRSILLRNSVFCTAFSIFLSTLMVLALSLRLFIGWLPEEVILLIFFLSIICFCISLCFFLLDVSLALRALKVEIEKEGNI